MEGKMDDLTKIIDIPAGGDVVQRRYRYQYLYTILLAIQMYQKTIPYEKLFCELAEDILAVLPNKKFIGIQIKTLEQQGQLFSYNDDAVIDSLSNFCKLYKKFPTKFEEFIFVSNVDFKESSNLENILEIIKKNKKLEKKYDAIIDKINKKSTLNKSLIQKVLKITSIQKGPSLEDIDSNIIHEHISKIPKCSNLTIWQLEGILKYSIGMVFEKSSKIIEDSIIHYVKFVKDGKKKSKLQEVYSKEITSETIKFLIDNVNPVYLKSLSIPSMELKEGSIGIMQKKMNLGKINQMEIDIMEKLSYATQVHFLEEYNKQNGTTDVIKTQLSQLEMIVTNEAAESRTETIKEDSSYGAEMMKRLESRLSTLSINRQEDIFHKKYEILKGMVGILTSDCKIWFSNHTKEDLK